MCTGNKNIKQHRFALLAELGETVFHADDLANLWGIRNPETLHTTLSRYVRQGLLYRIYRGFYSVRKPDRIDSRLLGLKALHGYAYVTAESVLFDAGVIHQSPCYITLAGEKSRRFTLAGRDYYCRKLTDRYLYNPAGVLLEGGVRTASLERAVADVYYYNPAVMLDEPGLIDWDRVGNLREVLGYPRAAGQRGKG